MINFQQGLVNKISDEEAKSLKAFPVDEEIKQAVWECESSKAPGLNGYNFSFLKKCWNSIGKDFIDCIAEFFRSGSLPRRANMTWVTLIPKIDEAKEVKDFHLISMIGCLYKVVAKIFANRMRNVMDGLVGESETTFVHGTQILDSVLIANEVVNWVKKRRKKVVLMKLDFHKAYDSVRWSFVEQVLQHMGFSRTWRKWI